MQEETNFDPETHEQAHRRQHDFYDMIVDDPILHGSSSQYEEPSQTQYEDPSQPGSSHTPQQERPVRRRTPRDYVQMMLGRWSGGRKHRNP